MDPPTGKLPNEVLLIILELTEPKTLNNVACCSKRFQALAGEALYARSKNLVFHRNPSVRNLETSLLRTCLQMPHLADRIEHLSMRVPRHCSNGLCSVSHVDIVGVLDSTPADRLNSQHDSMLKDHAEHDGILNLLLPRLRNLKSLDLEFAAGGSHFLRMNMKDFPGGSFLARVESVLFTSDHDVPILLPVPKFYTLPSVKSVYFRNIKWDGRQNRMYPRTPIFIPELPMVSSLTYEHLEIRHCFINLPILRRLIEASKHLKTFIHEVPGNRLEPGILRITEPDAPPMLTLRNHRYSLENLWLDYGDLDYSHLNLTVPRQLSFPEFPKLKCLRIPAGLFMGQNIFSPTIAHPKTSLPESIEELHLLHCDNHVEVLHDYLCSTLQDISKLKKLTIEISISVWWQRISLVEKKELAFLAELRNIEFIVLNNSVTERGSFVRTERKWGMKEDVEWALCTNGTFRGFAPEILNLENENDASAGEG